MLVTISNDEKKGAGYAIINLRMEDGSPLPEVGEDVNFMISRPGRGDSLGKGQWLQADVYLKADTIICSNGEINLFVGPDIVDNLEQLENYRFSIYLPDEKLSGALICQGIIQSPLENGHTSFVKEESPSSPITPPEMKDNQQTDATDESHAEAEQTNEEISDSAGQLSINSEEEQLHLSENQETLPPDSGQKKSGRKLIIFAVSFLLILLLAIMGYFLLKKPIIDLPYQNGTNASGEQQTTASNGTNSSSNIHTSQQNNEASGENSEIPDKDKKNNTPLQQVRSLLSKNSTPEELKSFLSSIPLDEENADARFLLVEELAERGDAESMYILGGFYDPNNTAPHGSIEKDPEQARIWYSQAAASNWLSAKPALEALKKRLEQEAEAGSHNAKQLLQNWK